MPPLVAHGQADERTPGEWIWMRAPLTGEVGEKQALGASRGARRLVDQLELDAGCQRVAEPAEAAAAESMMTSCASAQARRGRTRERDPRARSAAPAPREDVTPDVPSESVTTPASTAPVPTAFAAWSPPPATTGVPARTRLPRRPQG